jgi:putative component of membrane protein insertase Oxa1/YidC/SpoIIIJ protein YidD
MQEEHFLVQENITLNYVRYFIVTLLLFSLFYSYTITVEQSVIQEKIEKKLPMKIDKKGFLLTINRLEIIDIVNNRVTSNLTGSMQINQQSKWSKFLPKKSLHFKLETKTIPKLKGSSLSFELLSFKFNKFIKLKEVKGVLKEKIEKIKLPIKKLKKIAWFASVKHIIFQADGALLVTLGISKLMIFLLIPLFLLREIGMFVIVLYQKFLSPRKKYRCAKGELYQNGTCSSTTKEAFMKHGFIAGVKAYRKSTKECKEAYKKLQKKERADGTSCDCSYCGGCDGSCGGGDTIGSSSSVCNGVSCDVGGCSF